MEGLQLGMRSIPIAVWYLGKYLEMLVLNLIKKYGGHTPWKLGEKVIPQKY